MLTTSSLPPSLPPSLPSFLFLSLSAFLPYSLPFSSNTRFIKHQTKKTITVFDVGGVGIRDLAGDAFDFLRRSIHLISEHSPERSVREGGREGGRAR